VVSGALILAPFSVDALEALGESLPITYESWTDTRRFYAPEELSQRITDEDVGVLVVEADFVFPEVFQDGTPLRFLGVCRNGLDHVDVDSATRHGVAVVNTPGRNARGVAELTFGLIISMVRRVPQLNDYVKAGRWDNPVEPYLSMRGLELRGKTLGLIGLGSIGRTVSRLGRAFGMRVLAYDPHVGAPGQVVAGATLVSLEQVLSRCDVLSIHAAASADTRGLLDGRRLSMMKPGAYLVNTASHTVVDETALVQHLERGHIAGAALDVHQTHPILPNSPLLRMPNVILTPHVGGATDGTVDRQSWMMVEEIRRFLKGKRPRHLVNGEVWNGRG
jgi:phosphoglycerate dehydrogenase-like enzyme